MKVTESELRTELGQFIGTENHYKYMFGLVLTDGAKYLAERAGCFWLLDIIASYRRKEPFQVWELKVNRNHAENEPMAVVTMKEDTNEPELVRQEIPYTDFPMDSVKLFLIDNVILLPSEY